MPKRKPSPERADPRDRVAVEQAGSHRLPAGFAKTDRPRVCIVTTEFHGLFKNGGIGTANTGLALSLAGAGVPVTVLYANITKSTDQELRGIQDHYRNLGIELKPLTRTQQMPKPFLDARATSYAIYQYLRESDFGVVYFQDNCGHGFYSLAAKRAGTFPSPPLMFVVAHGPHEWVFELNALRWGEKNPIICAFLERASAAYADALISPSQYMADWMRARKWRLPANVFVEQNIVRVDVAAPRRDNADPITELVFFGRNELRKGLKIFCDAIDIVSRRIGLKRLDVSFLGKCSEVDGLHSGIYVIERSANWRTPPRMLWRLDQNEAVQYVSRPGVLAVIPSLAENSPCVVLECLQRGVPFVATNSGGTAELINPGDVADCLVPPDAPSLATKLMEAVERGHGPARLAISQAETEERWRAFHAPGGQAYVPASPESRVGVAIEPRPMVSICLAATGEAEEFSAILRAACDQTYGHFEVLVAGSANFDLEALPRLPEGDRVRRLSVDAAGAAQARIACAKEAKGQYLLFLDEANVILTRDCVATLVEAALRTGAAATTALSWKFDRQGTPQIGRDQELRGFPIGACSELGPIENLYGETLALVESAALRASGGFPDIADPSMAFWHFFASADVGGLGVELAPEPLCWHRGRPHVDRSKTMSLGAYRNLIDVFAAKPIESIRYLFETFGNPTNWDGNALPSLVGPLVWKQRDLALRVSRLDPNSKDAIDGFLQYCIERGRVEEALIYTLYNGEPGGAQLRWTTKDALVEFDWPFAIPWALELQLERFFSEQQIERIGAFHGEKALPLETTFDSAGRPRLRIVGERGRVDAPDVRVRIQLPHIYHFVDASREAGLRIEKISVRAADPTRLAAAGGLTGLMGRGASMASEAPRILMAPPSALSIDARPMLSAVVDDCVVNAERARLDQVYADPNYRHLDLTLIDVRFGAEAWREVKFKFCISGESRYLEFRDMVDWPTIFEDFPGTGRDDYGLVFRLRLVDVHAMPAWPSPRDQMLSQAVALLLPSSIGTLDSSELSAEECCVWRAEAAAFSASALLSMRKCGAGSFAGRVQA